MWLLKNACNWAVIRHPAADRCRTCMCVREGKRGKEEERDARRPGGPASKTYRFRLFFGLVGHLRKNKNEFHYLSWVYWSAGSGGALWHRERFEMRARCVRFWSMLHSSALPIQLEWVVNCWFATELWRLAFRNESELAVDTWIVMISLNGRICTHWLTCGLSML